MQTTLEEVLTAVSEPKLPATAQEQIANSLGFLTAIQVAALLNRSLEQLNEDRYAGRGPIAHQLGSTVLYSRDSVLRFIASRPPKRAKRPNGMGSRRDAEKALVRNQL